MNPLKFSVVLLFFFTVSNNTIEAVPTYLYHICTNTTTFARNSTYQTNLNLLLSSLSSNATRGTINGFFNTSLGRAPDDVYGAFLCRWDVTNAVCQDCVTSGSREVVQRCPDNKVAIIWYDECLLRYSNRSFFATAEGEPVVFMWNSVNVTNQASRFNRLVVDTMGGTAAEAASATGKKFAVKEANASFTGISKLYAMAQCTPDLPDVGCTQCLQIAISYLPQCCSGKQGGRVLVPSCNVRYELYQFFNASALPPPPRPPPPPPVVLPPTAPQGIVDLNCFISSPSYVHL